VIVFIVSADRMESALPTIAVYCKEKIEIALQSTGSLF